MPRCKALIPWVAGWFIGAFSHCTGPTGPRLHIVTAERPEAGRDPRRREGSSYQQSEGWLMAVHGGTDGGYWWFMMVNGLTNDNNGGSPSLLTLLFGS